MLSFSRRFVNTSGEYKISRIKQITGGFCTKCDEFNSHLVKYRRQGFVIVERYFTETCANFMNKLVILLIQTVLFLYSTSSFETSKQVLLSKNDGIKPAFRRSATRFFT